MSWRHLRKKLIDNKKEYVRGIHDGDSQFPNPAFLKKLYFVPNFILFLNSLSDTKV